MILDYITFIVENMEIAIKFYEKYVGLKIFKEVDGPEGHIVFMSNGIENSPAIKFVQAKEGETYNSEGMSFAIKSIIPLEELKAELEKDGFKPSEIIDMPPRPVFLSVQDPNNIKLNFFTI